jgi:hypothetical protein
LEAKIETLLSAMQSIASTSGSSPEILRLLDEESISLSPYSSKQTKANSTTLNPSIGGSPTLPTDPPPTALVHTNSLAPSQYSPFLSDLSSSEAEESLTFFRCWMLPCFPFFILSPDTTARQMQEDRPFLLQAICTTTTFSAQKKIARAEDLKRALFTSAFLNVQSNTDLLLGLLTYLAWSTDAFLGKTDLVSRLMMLAISLVYDMRLFKPSPPDVKLMMTITQGHAYENDRNTSEETIQSLMENQRAVLACFILSSKYAEAIPSIYHIDSLNYS